MKKIALLVLLSFGMAYAVTEEQLTMTYDLGRLLERDYRFDLARMKYKYAETWGHDPSTERLEFIMDNRSELECFASRIKSRGDADSMFELAKILLKQLNPDKIDRLWIRVLLISAIKGGCSSTVEVLKVFRECYY